MPNTGGDVYEVDFGGSVSIGDSVFYRIKAIDASVNHNVGYDPTSGYHAFAIVDRIPVGVWEPDLTPITSAPLINYLDSLSIGYEYHTSYPTFDLYNCMFICVGVYSNNYQITTSQANDLVAYLNSGGKCYLEGGDAWCYDPAGGIYRSYFGISEVGDGGTMSGNIDGVTGTFTQGMSFAYAGENSYIDRIAPIPPAFTIFTNGGYNRTVAYDAGTYRTIGSAFELGGLVDGTPPSTKDTLIEQILIFFGIIVGVEEENVMAPTTVNRLSVSPNPANRKLTFAFDINEKMHIKIEMFNVLGQKIAVIAEQTFQPGGHKIQWDFHDTKGRELTQGAYFYRIITEGETETGKILLIK
jgi:hypothetical protein